SGDHTFLIAASCAGVNFLITAFLMLSLGTWWRNQPEEFRWSSVPVTLGCAYVATVLVNAIRISTALQLRGMSAGGWMTPNQMHRFEGIFIYFGFLMLLFVVSERVAYRRRPFGIIAGRALHPWRGSSNYHDLFGSIRQLSFPLLIYYATTLALPLLNGA